MGALAVDYQISPTLEWRANATSETSNVKHEPFVFYWNAFSGAQLPRVSYDYDNIRVDNPFYKADTLALSTSLTWRFAEAWSADLLVAITATSQIQPLREFSTLD